jgi:hypothetical protein
MPARVALGVLLALLCVAAPAAAVTPTGMVSSTENADGSYNLRVAVAWDGCPAVCDWKMNLAVVQNPTSCPQRAMANVPEGVAYSPGMPVAPDPGPYAANGTKIGVVANIYYPRPLYSYVCVAAVGLEARADGVYTPSEACPDPRSGPYLIEPWGFAAGRCLRLYPIAIVALPLRQQRAARADPPVAAPLRLSLAEARAALRSRGVRGRTHLRRTASIAVRAVVRNASGTRRYRITKSSRVVRVRREQR